MQSYLLGGGRGVKPYQHFRGPKDISENMGPNLPALLGVQLFKFEICRSHFNIGQHISEVTFLEGGGRDYHISTLEGQKTLRNILVRRLLLP